MVQADNKNVQQKVQSFMVTFDFNKTPITQIADYIIIAASKHGTSDIHFDPRDEGMMVRFRMDGDLQDYTFVPKAYERNLTTRLKLLANMNITESRLPQDGAIKGDFGGTYLDMRVSALPTNLGEKIVIRILDYTRSLQGIDSLGFHPDNLEKLKRFMHLPNGIILTTGATGSGKSTTTYSILQGLNKPETNVITVEDPIEMNIEGINQVQVNSEIGMTFAAALRSILRQDPNVVLIGEIRDSETAQIAVRTSITGHLVLSTIHTNNALATVERLLDMNVERYLLSTALSGIISQRLAKTLCPECRIQRKTTKYEKKVFKYHLKKDIPIVWDANPNGCPKCHRGYKGRLAFHEVLEIDEEIRNALNNEHLEKEDLRKMVYTNKTITMLQDALIKCLDGLTSFDEVFNAIEIENINDEDVEIIDDEEQVAETVPETQAVNPEAQAVQPVVEQPQVTQEQQAVVPQEQPVEQQATTEAMIPTVQQPEGTVVPPIVDNTTPTEFEITNPEEQTEVASETTVNQTVLTLPTVTQTTETNVEIQPVEENNENVVTLPTVAEYTTTDDNQQVETLTETNNTQEGNETTSEVTIPTVSLPTVITQDIIPENENQELQETTIKPVIQSGDQTVIIPSVTTTTTIPEDIQRLGEEEII